MDRINGRGLLHRERLTKQAKFLQSIRRPFSACNAVSQKRLALTPNYLFLVKTRKETSQSCWIHVIILCVCTVTEFSFFFFCRNTEFNFLLTTGNQNPAPRHYFSFFLSFFPFLPVYYLFAKSTVRRFWYTLISRQADRIK